ncbi:prolipoprotein diacylglyceryl transferase [Kineococcus gynurae]|uniref:Phosphatidylglycerol--prolipoprotein diacylglyceryl transferase n=1 Tax=Kineococcus gynurae TaxID=452979 RepID=A0ABV5LQL9_9ACTN
MTALAGTIPSPTVAVWHLGPLPVRAYALCIIAGIVVGVWLTERRWRARGGRPDVTLDIVTWAVPLGVVGARLYHVISSPQAYFGEGGDPWRAFAIWDGGLGIWGAIALGALGAWIGARRAGVRLSAFADAIAPGLLIAQALGRWGNWFNNELYGRPTDVPWGLTIHQWDGSEGRAVLDAAGNPVVRGVFQPTFLYESLWCLAVAAVLIVLDRRLRLHRGQVMALYVGLYCLGRFFFELLRSDTATLILGLRVNTWVSGLVLVAGFVAFVVSRRRHGARTGDLPLPMDELVLPGRLSSDSSPDAHERDGGDAGPTESPTVSGTERSADESARRSPGSSE